MILIDVIVTQGINKFSRLQITSVRDHVRQQSIRSNVERDSQKSVGGSLVKLAVQQTVFGSLFDFELKDRVARGQINVVAFTRVPATHRSEEHTSDLQSRLHL